MDLAEHLEITTRFRPERDGFAFPNAVEDQRASWGTFLETFGAEQVRDMKRFSTFVLLWAYYALYTSFFEGVGIFQASGLCSGLAALSLERFCQDGQPANHDLPLTDEVRGQLTVRMGKILGKQVLIAAYDQCKRGPDNVIRALNTVRASLTAGIKAETAVMLWFLPSGRITQREFMTRLADAHAVVPYGMTIRQDEEMSRWFIPIYDVNKPDRQDIWVEVTHRDGVWSWRHNRDRRFSSERGMTLGTIPLKLFAKPAEFPFSGPFGLSRFLFDMLL
jgi:hypothetical protein